MEFMEPVVNETVGSNDNKFKAYEDSCYEFLKKYHQEDLLQILQTEKDQAHYSIVVDYVQLYEDNPTVGIMVLRTPDKIIERFDVAAKRALIFKFEELRENSKENSFPRNSLKFKLNVHVRLRSLPVCGELYRLDFPSCRESGSFLCMVGTVVRVSTSKLLEYSKTYQCNRCKSTVDVKATPSRYHSFPKSAECPNICPNAKVVPMGDLNSKNPENYSKFRDYQEIKLQEQVQKMDFGTMPKALTVVLEDDLVNLCKPGDDVSVTGTLYLRWKVFKEGQASESELVCRANSIQVNNDQRSSIIITDEMTHFIKSFWNQYQHNPFEGRNRIIASFCPQIYGMYVVKLAMCMVLAGGVSREVAGTRIRGECHMLLVGDPGTGKSQLLKYASKISPRSVMTTGIGTSSAGLTVSAVKDNGEWHLEAGALVLADGGVCCIDEFSCIKEHDRTSIHEAMEQQSISIAKAGMVVKVPTRVTMLAATNPKGRYDPEQPLSMNIAIASPLLSRFDILMVLTDAQNDTWDSFICDFILEGKDAFSDTMKTSSFDLWDSDRLQSYLVHIKQLQPTMTEEANEVISQYYQYQRSLDDRNAARTTVRLLESLRRLSEGHARLMYRNKVLLHDAITAISLIEASMQSSSIVDAPNSLHTAFPSDAMEEYRNQAELILQKLDLSHLWEKETGYLDGLNYIKSSNKCFPVIPRPPISKRRPTPILSQEQQRLKFIDTKEDVNIPPTCDRDNVIPDAIPQIDILLSPINSQSQPFVQQIGSQNTDSQETPTTSQNSKRAYSSSSGSSRSSASDFNLIGGGSDEDLFGSMENEPDPLFQSSCIGKPTQLSSQNVQNGTRSTTHSQSQNGLSHSKLVQQEKPSVTIEEDESLCSLTPRSKERKLLIRKKLSKFKRLRTDDDD